MVPKNAYITYVISSHTAYPITLVVDEVENQPEKIECGLVMRIITNPVWWLKKAHIRYALIQERVQALIIAVKSKFQFLLHHVKLLTEHDLLIGWLVLTICFLCKLNELNYDVKVYDRFNFVTIARDKLNLCYNDNSLKTYFIVIKFVLIQGVS